MADALGRGGPPAEKGGTGPLIVPGVLALRPQPLTFSPGRLRPRPLSIRGMSITLKEMSDQGGRSKLPCLGIELNHRSNSSFLNSYSIRGILSMRPPDSHHHRRAFLGSLALGAAAFSTGGAFAEELQRTPAQTEGPFYPNKLPLDTDNDLLIINDGITPAVGEITHLGGRVLDSRGNPIRNALVEIWQVDGKGVYIHTGDSRQPKRDTHFQGFGRFLTGSSGEYYFRTIKPVPYPGRTPHIHFKIKKADKELLTTQCYVKGETRNTRDMIYMGIRDPKARSSVTIDFAKLEDFEDRRTGGPLRYRAGIHSGSLRRRGGGEIQTSASMPGSPSPGCRPRAPPETSAMELMIQAEKFLPKAVDAPLCRSCLPGHRKMVVSQSY